MFTDMLKKLGFWDYMKPLTFKKVIPCGENRFKSFFDNAIKNEETIYMDWDHDPDGAFSIKEFKLMLDTLGYNKYVIAKPTYKRHILTMAYAKSIVDSGYRYVLIVDSSTNNREILEYFDLNNINCLVVDHHEIEGNSVFASRKVKVINPMIDYKERHIDLCICLSAGMVSALLIDWYVKVYHSEVYDAMNGYHLVMGYITLYSDSCEMSLYNASIADAIRGTTKIPPIVYLFMNKYTTLNRSFISWTMIPRINALFRLDRFNDIYNLFFGNDDYDVSILEYIESIYNKSKQITLDIVENVSVVERKNLIYAKITAEEISKYPGVNLRNFTGVVAQKIAEQYSCTAVTVIEQHSGVYEGSVRDTLSRNLLDTFSKYIQAAGHGPAFGISFSYKDENTILYTVDSELGKLKVITNYFITDLSNATKNSDALLMDIQLMCKFNEISGGSIPQAMCMVKIDKTFKITHYPKYTLVKWGEVVFKSFSTIVDYGMTIYAIPMFSGNSAECTVVTAGYN